MPVIINIYNNFKKNKQQLSLTGIGYTIALLVVMLILVSNIVRVIEKGHSNLEIYAYEASLLAEQEKRYEELLEKYNYVNSDEYKILLAREVLGLGSSNEELFVTKEDPTFFNYQPELIDVKEKHNFINWWLDLIQI